MNGRINNTACFTENMPIPFRDFRIPLELSSFAVSEKVFFKCLLVKTKFHFKLNVFQTLEHHNEPSPPYLGCSGLSHQQGLAGEEPAGMLTLSLTLEPVTGEVRIPRRHRWSGATQRFYSHTSTGQQMDQAQSSQSPNTKPAWMLS